MPLDSQPLATPVLHEARETWVTERGTTVFALCSCGYRAFVHGYPNEDLLTEHFAEVGAE